MPKCTRQYILAIYSIWLFIRLANQILKHLMVWVYSLYVIYYWEKNCHKKELIILLFDLYQMLFFYITCTCTGAVHCPPVGLHF